VDRIHYEEFMELAKGLSDKFLSDYGRVLIDSANLRAPVRTMRIGKDTEFLKNALIPGGSVGVERLANAAISNEGVASVFTMTPFDEAAQLGAQAISGCPLTDFEKACDNAVTSFLGRAKMVGFGLAPVCRLYSSARKRDCFCKNDTYREARLRKNGNTQVKAAGSILI
jgi:V/A-type H+-transporting ATPase subunit C